MTITTTNITNTYGAEISDIDLKHLNQEQASELLQLLYTNKFLLIRNQTISAQEYIAFAKQLGAPIKFIEPEYRHPDYPEIFVVSNVKNGNKKIGMDRVGRYWHSDSAFLQNPLPLTMLYAQQVPEQGGETAFVDMHHVLKELPQELQELLNDREVEFNAMPRYIITKKDVGLSYEELVESIANRLPSVTHPAIITHPVTQEKVLYISEGFANRICDLPKEQSDEILNTIFKLTEHSATKFAHQWRKGDIVIWDNRSVVHHAYPAHQDQARMLYRIGIQDQPFFTEK